MVRRAGMVELGWKIWDGGAGMEELGRKNQDGIAGMEQPGMIGKQRGSSGRNR